MRDIRKRKAEQVRTNEKTQTIITNEEYTNDNDRKRNYKWE